MAKNIRGKRDGSGPFKDSAQRQTSNAGRRQQAGLPCPIKKKAVEKTGLGPWADKRR